MNARRQRKFSTFTMLRARSRMSVHETRAFHLAEALGLIIAKSHPGQRDMIPNTVLEVARRMPGADFRHDKTALAEARALLETLTRSST